MENERDSQQSLVRHVGGLMFSPEEGLGWKALLAVRLVMVGLVVTIVIGAMGAGAIYGFVVRGLAFVPASALAFLAGLGLGWWFNNLNHRRELKR